MTGGLNEGPKSQFLVCRLDSNLSESIKSGMTVEQLHELLAKTPEWDMQRLQKMVQQTERHILGMDRTLDDDYTRVAVNSALEVRTGCRRH